jgi:hypothetical protein
MYTPGISYMFDVLVLCFLTNTVQLINEEINNDRTSVRCWTYQSCLTTYMEYERHWFLQVQNYAKNDTVGFIRSDCNISSFLLDRLLVLHTHTTRWWAVSGTRIYAYTQRASISHCDCNCCKPCRELTMPCLHMQELEFKMCFYSIKQVYRIDYKFS